MMMNPPTGRQLAIYLPNVLKSKSLSNSHFSSSSFSSCFFFLNHPPSSIFHLPPLVVHFSIYPHHTTTFLLDTENSATMLDKLKPPKLEIEDLCVSESDPIYQNAVRCVQTYWKQAASMTEGQRQKYLWYLQKTHIKHFVDKPFEYAGGTITAHSLYQRARDDAGNFVRLSWPVYLLLSSLYGDVPQRYKEAVAKKYGSSDIEDHATIYRHFYPTPTCTMKTSAVEPTTVQAPQNTPTREIPQESTPTETHKSVKSEDQDQTEMKTSFVKDGDDTHLENHDPSAAASETVLPQDPWNIDNVIDTMAVSKKKRSSKALGSPAKRTKLIDDEILGHIKQNTETFHKIMRGIQLEQHSKLQDIRHEVQKSTQVLNGMQNDLRQFMSAAASALKDIREHLKD
jgi:hypothetical protein